MQPGSTSAKTQRNLVQDKKRFILVFEPRFLCGGEPRYTCAMAKGLKMGVKVKITAGSKKGRTGSVLHSVGEGRARKWVIRMSGDEETTVPARSIAIEGAAPPASAHARRARGMDGDAHHSDDDEETASSNSSSDSSANDSGSSSSDEDGDSSDEDGSDTHERCVAIFVYIPAMLSCSSTYFFSEMVLKTMLLGMLMLNLPHLLTQA